MNMVDHAFKLKWASAVKGSIDMWSIAGLILFQTLEPFGLKTELISDQINCMSGRLSDSASLLMIFVN